MEICKKKIIINIILSFLFVFSYLKPGYAEVNFENIENKQVSYLDFFLLKFENTLNKKSLILRRQLFATRVQYSNIGIGVDFDKKSEKISVKIYAIMDRNRYSKKKYEHKISDCNQVRNLIFYQQNGYKFFTQKRDPALSEKIMEDIFKEVFFNNISLDEKEIKFLLDKMFVHVTILHPIQKKELSCSGKINEYELN
tara:strand:+ start:857 stop:1447 length:591 start_codon:yes stop_codon:yes gene_type:complete